LKISRFNTGGAVMPRNARHRRTGNRLIDRLPEDESQRLTSHGQLVKLPPGETLYEQQGPIAHVYFPTSGCCCHVVPLDEGRHIEATTVGKEGMLGIHLALGLDFSPLKAVSVVPGTAIRVPVGEFSEIVRKGGALDALVKKYAAYCLLAASQTIACNALHTVEQRVCRRLLMAHDRVENGEFSLTQDLLSQMLGVRRPSITLAARDLQAANLIEYRRGVIKILNRPGLEAASCECYQITRSAYHSIMEK
jgi:CRP-like cAMP-binding protein